MKEEEMAKKIIEMANRDYRRITNELAMNGKLNTGLIGYYISSLFRVSFANVEKAIGLEKARLSFTPLVDFMADVMLEGAYDKENDKIKR